MRAPQQILRTHRSLKASCTTLWWRRQKDDQYFFIFPSNGAPVEWNWQGETCPSTTLSTTNPTWTDLGSNPGLRWNWQEKTCPSATLSITNPTWTDLGSNPGLRGNWQGKNLPQCDFVHNKLHMYWPGIEPGPPRWEAGDLPPEPWHGLLSTLYKWSERLASGVSAWYRHDLQTHCWYQQCVRNMTANSCGSLATSQPYSCFLLSIISMTHRPSRPEAR
jgi:hypothetical protein